MGKVIEDETVVLDGGDYTNVTFLNCDLEYRGGPLTLDSCTFDGCHYTFANEAASTLDFLKMMSTTDVGWEHVKRTLRPEDDNAITSTDEG